jgi:hypothetical protein
MANTPSVFISFSSHFRDWALVFAENLRTCGFEKVFIDAQSIAPGRSWWTSLQEGLSQAEQLVLLVTPEAMASPWVHQEVVSFLSLVPESSRSGRLFPVMLVTSPVPLFLRQLQSADFREYDHSGYRRELARLIQAMRGLPTAWRLPQVKVPPEPLPLVPAELRENCWKVLASGLTERRSRVAVANFLEQSDSFLEGFPDLECAANTAIQQVMSSAHSVKRIIGLLERAAAAEIVEFEAVQPLVDALREHDQEVAETTPMQRDMKVSVGIAPRGAKDLGAQRTAWWRVVSRFHRWSPIGFVAVCLLILVCVVYAWTLSLPNPLPSIGEYSCELAQQPFRSCEIIPTADGGMELVVRAVQRGPNSMIAEYRGRLVNAEPGCANANMSSYIGSDLEKLLTRNAGQLTICREKRGTAWHGTWHFPGISETGFALRF